MSSRRVRRAVREPFLREVRLDESVISGRNGHPWDLPVVAGLARDGFALHPKVTFLIGENGTGKSTLLEALAVALGMPAEGGSSNLLVPEEGEAATFFAFSRVAARQQLATALQLVRGLNRPRTDFFLRAESLFPVATTLESLPDIHRPPMQAYGGVPLTDRSHGEGFLAILLERFGPDGLYLLDEPEAALSTQNLLTCLRRIHELVGGGCQFVIATHSPLLLAYPDATIYECGPHGLQIATWEDAEPVRLTRAFLDAPERFLAALLED